MEFNWLDFFRKTKVNAERTAIIKCEVCGDLLYYSDGIDIDDFGWEKLENGERYVCHNCLHHSYISEEEAQQIDKENEELFGTAINPDLNKPMREVYTWDEHIEYNKEYKDALYNFLITEDKDCYKKYATLFSD